MRTWLMDDEGRLRTGWRLLVFGALIILIQVIAGLLASLVVDPTALFAESFGAVSLGMIVTQLLSIISITTAAFVARRWLDQRSITSLGLDLHAPWLRHLALGTLLGIGLQALIFLTQLALGWLVIEHVGWRGPSTAPLGLLVLGLVFVAVAWNEELLTRGYLLQNLEAGLGTAAAVAISSVLFGFLHIFNSNATIVATLGVAFAGVLLAMAYLVTRQLWLPIGLHLGWNFGEGPLFGFPVSGLDAGGLVTHRNVGPEIITGGAFGPEAGLIAVAAELLGIGLLWAWWRRSSGETVAQDTAEHERL